MRNALVCTIGLALVTVTACKKEIKSTGAVERAIRAHLERDSNLALNAFTTEISNVKFEGDNAEAVVKFKSKQVPDMSVQVQYTLRKEGDHWVVQSSSVNPHGGGMPTPGGQVANPHQGLGTPTAPPPASQPQPAPQPAPSH